MYWILVLALLIPIGKLNHALGADVYTVDNVVLMTEEYPPYNYTSQGELKGIAVDVMVMMLEKLKAKQGRTDISVVPWARGYKTVLNKPNSCLFAMAWTKERSKLFKFVGPLEKFDSAFLFAKKSRRIVIKSYADLKAYKIGVMRYDIAQENLKEQGLTANIVDISSSDFLAKMLASDRIDMWAYGADSVATIFRRNGLNPDDFEGVYRLKSSASYYAFNRDTPDSIVARFQASYDELLKENRIRPVIDSYLKNSNGK